MLQFRSLPFTTDASALKAMTGGLNSSGPAPAARRREGATWSSPDSLSWSCEYFGIRVTPPPLPGLQQLQRGSPSPFPKTVERVSSKRDFVAPPPAVVNRLLGGCRLDRRERQEAHGGAADTDVAMGDTAGDRPEHLKTSRPYTMDLTIVVSKKRINKLATVRNTIRKRIRACIRLAVQHGVFCEVGKQPQVASKKQGKASPAREEEDVRLFMDEREAGTHKWLLPGHIYVIHPTLEVFQLPLPLLHQRVCQGLKAVRVSHTLEWRPV